jgi:peptidyl-prolyl cis-trans isomerase C
MPILRALLAMMLFALVMPSHILADEFERQPPADKDDPEVVFAYQGDAVLTQEGIDAAFSRIPPEHRNLFIRDGAQVDRMVRNIMKTEVIAQDALDNNLDEDPIIRERMIQAAHKELAEAWIERLKDNAPEADYEAMAYEDYVANPEDYRTKEYIDVTHILIGTQSRSDEEALALAGTVRERALESPESFSELVLEYSDDPGKAQNKGSYLRVSRGQMAKQFEDAAFALAEDGDISEPVQTEYGYHIIRLDKRYAPRDQEFEMVREDAVLKMQQKHESQYQERYIKALLADGIVLPEGSVEIMLKRHFGENLENAPGY